MSQEQAEQLLYQMQMLENYFTDLSQRESTLYNILKEASSAIISIKSINEKPNSDTLIPVGMGTYVKTQITSHEKIILNIGAGIAIEKDSSSAINYLEARIKEIEVALQETAAKKQDAAAKLEQGREHMNQLMQTASHHNPE